LSLGGSRPSICKPKDRYYPIYRFKDICIPIIKHFLFIKAPLVLKLHEVEPMRFEKEAYVSKQGSIPRYHNFIVSGHLRKYHYNDKDEEITSGLNNGPKWFTSYQAFISSTVSNENVQCITDVELIRVHRDDLDHLADTGITQKDYTILIFQKILNEQNKRLKDLHSLSAEERYLKLLRYQPNIVKHVPLKYIASHLGIQPGSLSRIRKELSINLSHYPLLHIG
jgi:CRP-like cAMP-binding protein